MTLSPSIEKLLEPYPIINTIPVQWGEMDAFRHVNNLIYLRWSETGRITYFDALGLNTTEPEKQEFSVILGWQDCKYIFPVTYPDTVYIGTTITNIGKDRFNMQCAIFSKKHERIVSLSNHSVVIVNYKIGKKVAVPQELIDKVEALEGKQIPRV